MASGAINPPGQTPESPEERDERVAAENEKARIERDLRLAETEALNALRVHLPVRLIEEAALHGAEFVLEELGDDITQKSGE